MVNTKKALRVTFDANGRPPYPRYSRRLIAVIGALALGALLLLGLLQRYLADYGEKGMRYRDNPATAQVVPRPACPVHGNKIIVMQRIKAGTRASNEYLKKLSGRNKAGVCTNVDVIMYAAEYVPIRILIRWYHQVLGQGRMAGVLVNAFFTNPEVKDKAKWVTAIQTAFPRNFCFFVGVNSIPTSDLDQGVPGSYNASVWRDAIARGSGKYCPMGDFYPDPTAAQTDLQNSGDPYIPVYLPYGAPSGYGSVDEYDAVGERTFELPTVKAIGAVQAFTQGGQRPSPALVGKFAARLHRGDHPVPNIILYSQGVDAKNPTYMRNSATAVRPVLEPHP